MYKLFKKYNIFRWNDDTYWVKGTPDDVKLKCVIESIMFVIGGVILYTSFVWIPILVFEILK